MNYLRSTHCAERGGSLCDSLDGPLGDLMTAGLSDPRFVASIPQSPGNFEFLRSGVESVSVPTLLITATRDQASTEEGSNRPYWEALTAPSSLMRRQHRRLSFLEAGHATFTVACLHVPTTQLNEGCGPDFTPFQEAQQLMLAYSLIFGRAYVLGDPESSRIVTSQTEVSESELPPLPSWAQWLSAP